MTLRVRSLTSHARVLDTFSRGGADKRHTVLVKVNARKTRSRLANVGIPLGIAASIMSTQWWALLPLGVCAWWWAPRNSGWEWAVAIGRGLITAEWALVGAYALGAFPERRAIVGAVWVLAAVLLAASAKLAR